MVRKLKKIKLNSKLLKPFISLSEKKLVDKCNILTKQFYGRLNFSLQISRNDFYNYTKLDVGIPVNNLGHDGRLFSVVGYRNIIKFVDSIL